MSGKLRARLVAEGLRPSAWGNAPFDRYGEHRHDYDKVLVVAAGSITFRLPESDGSFALAEGDRLDLPAGTTHGADVGPAGVGCLEAHLPAGTLAGLRHVPGWGVSGDGTGAPAQAPAAAARAPAAERAPDDRPG